MEITIGLGTLALIVLVAGLGGAVGFIILVRAWAGSSGQLQR